jgi:molybdopterin synthase sulfur carrier subunit
VDSQPAQIEHEVWIPALHRDLTGGAEIVLVAGDTIGEVIANLDARFPGIQERLVDDGRIRPYISVAINGAITHRGLHQRLRTRSEIHFVPALGGG